jgi:hypothetical protein
MSPSTSDYHVWVIEHVTVRLVQELAIPEAEFDKMMEIYREHSQGGNELDPSVILEHVRDVRYA